ncbi:MAG: sensor histidine kinase, partial [Bacteroidota bacterium]
LKKRAHISVSDSGPGIPDEIMNEIFTPFYTTRTEGTGLGLAIVKEIIDLHNGTIIVKNNPDKGCTFQILLHTNGNIFRSPLNSNHE